MSPEKCKQLIEIFPEAFADLHPMEPFALFGFECGGGWFDLLKDLIGEVKLICEKMETPPEESGFKIVQVKQKYATLRFYTNVTTDAIDEAIDRAEERSAITCENCGKPGTLRHRGYWCYTACDGCV